MFLSQKQLRMPKVKMEFNLPDEEVEFNMSVNGRKMHLVLWEMDQWLRANTKYAPDGMSEDTYSAYEKCREKLRELMMEENISFD